MTAAGSESLRAFVSSCEIALDLHLPWRLYVLIAEGLSPFAPEVAAIKAGLRNLDHAYKAEVDAWAVFDNVGEEPALLAWGKGNS